MPGMLACRNVACMRSSYFHVTLLDVTQHGIQENEKPAAAITKIHRYKH